MNRQDLCNGIDVGYKAERNAQEIWKYMGTFMLTYTTVYVFSPFFQILPGQQTGCRWPVHPNQRLILRFPGSWVEVLWRNSVWPSWQQSFPRFSRQKVCIYSTFPILIDFNTLMLKKIVLKAEFDFKMVYILLGRWHFHMSI